MLYKFKFIQLIKILISTTNIYLKIFIKTFNKIIFFKTYIVELLVNTLWSCLVTLWNGNRNDNENENENENENAKERKTKFFVWLEL